MLKPYNLIILFSFIFIGWNCNPDEPDPQDESLFYSSFNSDSETPNVKGWTLSDSLSSYYIQYSHDVVNSYYYYSLKLQRDSLTTYVPNISTTIIKAHSYSNKKYFLSFYAKGVGEVIVGMKTINESRTVIFNIYSVGWKSFNPRIFDCSGNSDTLTITFRPLNSDVIPFLLLDNVSVQTVSH